MKLKGKRFTSTGPIILKVNFGKETASVMNARTVFDYNKEEDSKDEKSSPEVSKDVQNLLKEAAAIMSFQCRDGNLEHASDMHLVIENISENTEGNTCDDLCESLFQVEVDKMRATIDTRTSDSGTSPDSEVINPTPAIQVNEKDTESFHHALSSADTYLASGNISILTLPCKDTDKGKRDDEHCQNSDFSINGEVPSPENTVDVHEMSKLGPKEKVGDVSYHSNASTSMTASLNVLDLKGFPNKPLPFSEVTDLAISCVVSKSERGTEVELSPILGIKLEPLESNISEKLLACTKGQKLAKS